MRREYGRLAEIANHPCDARRQALIEEQLAVTLSVLHHHHTEEDAWLWPTLRERAPDASDALDRLEAQHSQVDPLIAVAGDVSRPLPLRAPALAQLHEAINFHLDDEERVVLPLSAHYITAQEWDDFGARALAAIPRQDMPIVLGWASGEATSHEWTVVSQMNEHRWGA